MGLSHAMNNQSAITSKSTGSQQGSHGTGVPSKAACHSRHCKQPEAFRPLSMPHEGTHLRGPSPKGR